MQRGELLLIGAPQIDDNVFDVWLCTSHRCTKSRVVVSHDAAECSVVGFVAQLWHFVSQWKIDVEKWIHVHQRTDDSIRLFGPRRVDQLFKHRHGNVFFVCTLVRVALHLIRTTAHGSSGQFSKCALHHRIATHILFGHPAVAILETTHWHCHVRFRCNRLFIGNLFDCDEFLSGGFDLAHHVVNSAASLNLPIFKEGFQIHDASSLFLLQFGFVALALLARLVFLHLLETSLIFGIAFLFCTDFLELSLAFFGRH